MDRTDETERLWASFRSDPQSDNLFNALKQVCFLGRDWKTLVQAYIMRANAEGAGWEAGRLFVEAGAIYENRLSSPEAAAGMYEKALQADASNPRAVERLGELSSQIGDPEKAAHYLGLRLRLAPDDKTRVSLLGQMAEAFRAAGRDGDAVEALRNLVQIDPRHGEALKALADILHRNEAWEDLASAYELMAACAPTAEERRKILFRTAKLSEEKLNRPTEAIRLFREMIADRPIPMILKQLERLTRSLSDWEGLAEILKAEADQAADPSERASYLFELGKILDEQLGRSDESIESLREVVGEEKFNAETLAMLEDLYTRQERFEDLVEVLTRKEALAEDKRLVRLQLGELLAGPLHDPDRALPWFEKAHDAAPDPAVATRLTDLYHITGRFADLASWYESLAAKAQAPQEKAGYFLQKGRTELDRLDEPGLAAESFMAAVEADPDHPEASTLLHTALEQAGRLDDLAALERTAADAQTDPARKVPHLLRLAGILSRMTDRRGEAVEILWNLLEIDPGHFKAIQALGALLDATNRHGDLVRLYMRTVDLLDDMDEVAALHVKTALLYRDRLQNPAMALSSFRKAFLTNRANRDSIEALKPLLLEEGRIEECLDVCQAHRDIVTDTAEEVSVLLDTAHIYLERLERLEDASAAFEEALRLDMHNTTAFESLEGIYRKTQAWPSLADLLSRKAANAPDRRQAAEMHLEVARLFASEIEAPDRAIPAYERSLAFDPSNAEAQGEVEALYAKEGMWADQANALQTLAQLAGPTDAGYAHLLAAARVAEERLEDREMALTLLKEADSINPTDLFPLQEQARLFRLDGDHDRLVEVLRGEQVRRSEFSLPVEREIAQTYCTALADPEKALASFHRILAMAPDDLEALDAVVDLTETLALWTEHLQALEAKLSAKGTAADLGTTLLRMGRTHRERLGDPTQALVLFLRAFESSPASPPVREALSSLATEQGDWASLTLVLRFEIDAASGDERRSLLRELAALWEERLLDRTKTAETLREILAHHPDDVEVLTDLSGVLERADDTDGVRETLTRLVGLIEDKNEKTTIFLRLADLELVGVDDVEAALAWMKTARDEDPNRREVLHRLARLYARTQRTDEHIATLWEIFSQEQTTAGQVETLMGIGAVEMARGRVEEGAVPVYEKVLALAPDHVPALHQLRGIASTAQDRKGLSNLIEKELTLMGRTHPMARDLLMSLGRLREALSDEDGAVTCYRDVLAVHPGFLPALHGMEKIFLSRDDPQALIEACEALAEAVEKDHDRRDLHTRIGLLRREGLDDLSGAARAFRKALDLDKTHLPAIRGLAACALRLGDNAGFLEAVDLEVQLDVQAERKFTLLKRAGFDLAAAEAEEDALRCLDRAADIRLDDDAVLELLSGLLSKAEQWERLADILKARLDLAIDPDDAAKAALHLAQVLHNRLARPEEARDVLAVPVRVTEHPEVLSLYHDLCERLGDFPGLAEALTLEASRTQDDAQRLKLLRDLGTLWRDRLEDPRRAATFFDRAFRLDPSDDTVAADLKKLYLSMENYTDLVSVNRRLLTVPRDALYQDRLRTELGALYEHHLDNPGKALAAYALVETEGPHLPEALEGLARLYAASGRYLDVIQTRRRQLSCLEGEGGRTDLLNEIGALQDQKLLHPQGAVEAYEEVRESAPDNPIALAALDRLYAELGRWDDLLRLKNHRIAKAADEKTKAVILQEAAEVVSGELSDPSAAANYLFRAHHLDPGNPDLTDRLRRELRAADDWEGLTRLEEETLDRTPAEDRDTRFALLGRIGDILKTRSPDLARAAQVLDRALKLRPDDPKTLRSLAAVYERMGNLTGRAEIAERELSSAGDEEAPQIRRFLGELYEKRLGAYDDAVRVLRPLLEKEPRDRETLRALKRCYRKAGRFEELVAIYEVEFMHVPQREHGARILCIIGMIYREELLSPEEAITSYLEALELMPSQTRPMDALIDLHKAMGDRASLAAMYIKRAGLCKDREEEAQYRLNAGALFEKEGDDDGARTAFEGVLGLRPRNASAVDGLARIYEAHGLWPKLIDILKIAAEIAPDDKSAVERYVKMGEVWLDRLDDPEEAYGPLTAAGELRPDHLPALRGLERIHRLRSAWAAVVENLKAQSAVVTDSVEKAYIHGETGRILLEELHDSEAARPELTAATEADPEAVAPLAGLADIAGAEKAWPLEKELLTRLARLLGEEDAPGQRVDVFFKLGRVLERLNAPDEEAVEQYRHAVAVDPSHLPSLRAASRIHYSLGQWERALEVLEPLAASEEDTAADRLAVHRARCLVETERLDEAASALEGLEWPTGLEREYFDVLLDIREKRKDWEGAFEVLEEGVSAFEDSAFRSRAHSRAGHILLDHLDRPDEAAEHFEAALDENPSTPRAREGLADALEKAGDWTRAVSAWKNVAEASEDDRTSRKAWIHLGRCYFEGEGRIEPAIEAYRTAWRLDPWSLDAVDAMEKVRQSVKDWPGWREDLETILPKLADAPASLRVGLLFRLGEVQVRTDDPQAAVKTFRKVLKEDPAHLAGRIHLAQLYGRGRKTLDWAIAEHVKVMEIGPLRHDSLRRLSALFKKQGDPDRRLGVLGTLFVFGHLEGRDREDYENLAPEKPPPCPGATKVLAELRPDSSFGPLGPLFDMIDPYIGRAASTGLDPYEVTRKSLKGGDLESPGGRLSQALASSLALEGFLYVTGHHLPASLVLVPGDPPALVVNPAFARSFDKKEQSFLLGRALALAAARRVSVSTLDAKTLAEWLGVMARYLLADIPPAQGDPKEERMRLKAVKSALPRRVRKAAEPLLREYWDRRDDLSLEDFRDESRRFGNRMGLLFAGNPAPALAALWRVDSHMKNLPPEGATAHDLLKDPDTKNLVLFTLSERCASARQAMALPAGEEAQR
jgi:tetratricopeptide (TPR) repeat protein